MTEKRFESRQSINKTGYVVIDNEKQYTFPVMSKDDCYMFCKVLNALHEENEQLKKDNFKAFALLGDIRALLRTNSYDTVIEKINKFEKEVLK